MNRTSTQSWLLPAALCAALLWPWSPAWGATGSVVGRITDASTADSLPGASVYLRQLGRGVAADARGRFEFGGLPAGYYTIEVSAIGYIRWRQENIRVQSGAETTISAALTPTILPLGEEIVVYGKRVLLDVNEPATQRTVEGRDIEKTTAGGLTDVVLQQPGVAQVDREVHVRGARTYETGYLIDGVSVADPFLRQGMAVRPSPAAVESFRVQTGGIDAASGSASAGVVEVETRDPSQQLSGSVSYTTDQVSPVREGRWNSDGAQFVLSGPLSALGLPRLSSDSRLEPGFVLNLSGDLTDTHLGSGQPNSSIWGGTRWAPRSNNRYQSLVKLAWRLSPRHRLVTLFTGETTIDQDRSVLDTHIRTATYSYGWPFAYGRDLANYTTFTRQANSQSLRWEDHGQNNIFTATLARVFSRLHGDVNGKTPDQYVPPQDTGPVSIQTTPDSSVFTINPGDGFYDVGDGDQWYDHFVETYSAKGEWEGRPRPNWTLKPGGSVETQSLQVIDIFRPWLGLGGLNTDAYRARPTSAALLV
ncbi:MAG: TonB-dependent receptor [candidate division Zixibacteria bacterium]|nr:TonB-dependent receptor [candidate division Zixibacteria bacterium]